jgi:hypothetical protein
LGTEIGIQFLRAGFPLEDEIDPCPVGAGAELGRGSGGKHDERAERDPGGLSNGPAQFHRVQRRTERSAQHSVWPLLIRESKGLLGIRGVDDVMAEAFQSRCQTLKGFRFRRAHRQDDQAL